jgi:hypothetical protein
MCVRVRPNPARVPEMCRRARPKAHFQPQPVGIPRDWSISRSTCLNRQECVNQDSDSDPNEAQASDHFRGSSEERPNPSPCQGSDEYHDESRGARSDSRDRDIDLHKMRG